MNGPGKQMDEIVMGEIDQFTCSRKKRKNLEPVPVRFNASSVRQTTAGAADNTILALEQRETSMYITLRKKRLPKAAGTGDRCRSLFADQAPRAT